MTHDFVSKDIDKIMKVCYDLNIKQYNNGVIEYEQFSKRYNQRDR